jgi:hypothetical protein
LGSKVKDITSSGLGAGTPAFYFTFDGLRAFLYHATKLNFRLTAPCSNSQQRFGRLLKVLKSADPAGNSDGGTPKLKAASKRAAAGKRNGSQLRNAKASSKHPDDENDEDEIEDEFDEEETPIKKHKSEKPVGKGKWKSIFGPDGDILKVEYGEDSEDGAVTTKAEDNLDGEVVD